MDGRPMERFSHHRGGRRGRGLRDRRLGRGAQASARHDAAWRAAPVPEPLAADLPKARTGRRVTTLGEAVQLRAFHEVATDPGKAGPSGP